MEKDVLENKVSWKSKESWKNKRSWKIYRSWQYEEFCENRNPGKTRILGGKKKNLGKIGEVGSPGTVKSQKKIIVLEKCEVPEKKLLEKYEVVEK